MDDCIKVKAEKKGMLFSKIAQRSPPKTRRINRNSFSVKKMGFFASFASARLSPGHCDHITPLNDGERENTTEVSENALVNFQGDKAMCSQRMKIKDERG